MVRVGVEAGAHLGALVFPAAFVRTHGLRRVDRHERAVGGECARGEERRVSVGQPDLERVAHLEVLHHRRARQALVVCHARAVGRGRGSALGRAFALRPDVVQLGEGRVVREERRRRVIRRIDLVEAEGVARGVELLAQLLLESVVLLVRLHRGGAAAAELGRAELLVRLARARLLLLLLLCGDHRCVRSWVCGLRPIASPQPQKRARSRRKMRQRLYRSCLGVASVGQVWEGEHVAGAEIPRCGDSSAIWVDHLGDSRFGLLNSKSASRK